MHMRPRCSEWLPLQTQQLRLRSLQRIQAVNITICDDLQHEVREKLIYYTLHYTKDDVAFYRSEALPLRHKQIKWADIYCENMLKSSANCVCIKVWTEAKQTKSQKQTWLKVAKEPLSDTLSKELSKVCLSPSNLACAEDSLLFTWGVYFSGLMLFNMDTDTINFQPNTLIFQLNANYFAAPESFTTDSLRDELSAYCERLTPYIPITATTTALEAEYYINSPHASPTCSPTRGNSPIDKPAHWQEDLLRMAKQRYETLSWPVTNVRKSYNLADLLLLQQLQRKRKQTQEDIQQLEQDIKQLSVRCITKEQLNCKPRRISYSTSPHSMGRALSVLLAEEYQVDPQALLRTQSLQEQVESLRSKQRLLLAERQTYAKRNTELQQELEELRQSNERRRIWLLDKQNELTTAEEELSTQQQLVDMQRNMRRCIMQHLEQRMSTLCLELREIYPITRNKHGFQTVCGISFPNMEAYMSDAKYASSISVEHVSPMALSAALGYIAHLVQIISIIIDRPLRNPIIHEGSRSRIMDIIKEIPYSSREFPLFSRSTIPSKAVKYAIYLLNQNIAQLCYDITGLRCEPRATIDNILRIFNTFAEYEELQQQVAAEHKDVIDATQQTTNTHSHTTKHLRRSRLTLLNSHNRSINSKINSALSFAENGIGDRVSKCNLNINHGDKNSSSVLQIVGMDNCDETLSKSHSSVDMNFVPMSVPIPTTTTEMRLKPQQMPSSQSHAIMEHPHMLPRTRVCRSVGSYSDSEDDHLKDLIDYTYSNSDSNLNFHSDHV